jgi:hypothetical protein
LVRAVAMIALALSLLAGCTHSASRSSTAVRARSDVAVAVLPVVWATRRPDVPLDAARIVARAVERDVRVRSVALDRTARAVEAEPGGCAGDVACVRRVGARLGAAHVVRVELAELGGTVLVRATVVDVRLGTRSATRQEVVREAGPARLEAALERVGREVARPLAPPRAEPVRARAFWQREVVWILAGVVVVGAATAVTVAATSGPSDEPDFLITPP